MVPFESSLCLISNHNFIISISEETVISNSVCALLCFTDDVTRLLVLDFYFELLNQNKKKEILTFSHSFYFLFFNLNKFSI